MKRIIQFFKDSYGELRKVTWPTRDEAVASTKVVIVAVLISAFLLGIVDIILFQGIDFLFRSIPS